MVAHRLIQADSDRARRDYQNARSIIIIEVPHPENNTEHLKDVKWVQHFRDQDFEDRLLGDVNLTVAEFHALHLAQSLVSETSWTGELGSQLVIGECTIKLDWDKFVSILLPLEVDESVSEEDRKPCQSCIASAGSLKELL